MASDQEDGEVTQAVEGKCDIALHPISSAGLLQSIR
jgi:hypothetical protein